MALRVLVCGDRDWTNGRSIALVLAKLVLSANDPLVVIEGEASGADTLAREAAEVLLLEVEPYFAEWAKYGLAAGPKRNERMLDEGRPDLVLAFHPNIKRSKGTKNMIEQANARGVEVRLYAK